MSTTDTSPVAPEVRLFLARVRHELADLDPEEVGEMTDGLEADLTELVAERGASALGSPVEYAGELRAAAGLEPQVRRPQTRRSPRERVTGWLDAGRARLDRAVDRLPGDQRPLLAWLRPLWWVLRGWLALQVASWSASALLGIGYYEGVEMSLLPRLGGFEWPALIIAVAVSVQIGRGRLWPGTTGRLSARLVLLGLNALAVVVAPFILSGALTEGDEAAYWRGYESGYSAGTEEMTSESGSGIDTQAGVYSSGHWVSNIYPYDASGKPLVGVQLFDQVGNPISVVSAPECPDDVGGWTVNPVEQDPNCWDPDGEQTVQGRVPYPWSNGAAQLENVFPLPLRMQDDLHRTADAFSQPDRPAIGELPLATVPPVSLPGITPSVQAPPTRAAR